MSAKRNLNLIIELLMKRRQVRTFFELAKDMNMHASTFSNKVKMLSENMDFACDFAKQLAQHLKVSTDDLENMVCNYTGRDDVYKRLIEVQLNEFRRLHERYVPEIFELTRRLDKGDIYTLVTCCTPIEHYDKDLLTEIVSAIERGVTFRYIFPNRNNEILSNLINKYPGTEVANCFDLAEVHEKIFLKLLRDNDITEISIREHVKCASSANPLLVTPFTKFIQVSQYLLGSLETVVFAEARIGSTEDLSVIRYWYPVPRVDSQHINYMIKEALEE